MPSSSGIVSFDPWPWYLRLLEHPVPCHIIASRADETNQKLRELNDWVTTAWSFAWPNIRPLRYTGPGRNQPGSKIPHWEFRTNLSNLNSSSVFERDNMVVRWKVFFPLSPLPLTNTEFLLNIALIVHCSGRLSGWEAHNLGHPSADLVPFWWISSFLAPWKGSDSASGCGVIRSEVSRSCIPHDEERSP
jgi:hypothetical protein